MKSLIYKILELWLFDLDSDNSNISEKELEKIINILEEINKKELTKTESANYIGVSRATFDNYVAKGLIPKGKKTRGCSSFFWNKKDLEKFLNND